MIEEYRNRIITELAETIDLLDTFVSVPLQNVNNQMIDMVVGTLEIGVPFLETCVKGYNECGGRDNSLAEVSSGLSLKLGQLNIVEDVPTKISIAKEMLDLANSVNLSKLKEASLAA